MKIISSYIFRALCAMLVGFLLVSNPETMTTLLVQIIGGLFALSGLIAIIAYYINAYQLRRTQRRIAESETEQTVSSAWHVAPVFPVVGVGSLAFGAFLLAMPHLFISILMYVLGALLLFVGFSQVQTLISYRRVAPLAWSLFIMPLLIIAAGIIVVCYPMEASSLPFTILGIAYICYGVSEFLYGFRLHRYQRLLNAEQARFEEIKEDTSADEVTDNDNEDSTPTTDVPSAQLLPMALLLLAFTTALHAQTGPTFTVAAMNVDGLPAKIATISINPDSKGSAGAQAISQKLATKGYDIIALSEDFNYHGSIMSALGDIYDAGTHRGSINAGSSFVSLFNGLTFDTDGLELLWKKGLRMDYETWTQWSVSNGKFDQGSDELIKKGYRYYMCTIAEGVYVDIYILHMDAETNEKDNEARESQWTQLVNDILGNPSTRPKIVMGDTNCRYTRDRIRELFINRVNADGRYTVNDCWIEKCKNGNYPTLGSYPLMTDDLGYVEGEIVDKIFYMNPRQGLQLKLKSFKVDTDFNGEDGSPLADHYPVVATFTAEGVLLDPYSYWRWTENSDADRQAYADYRAAYETVIPYTTAQLPDFIKSSITTTLQETTDMYKATEGNGTTIRLRSIVEFINEYVRISYVLQDATSRLKNPSFELGDKLVSGQVQGWTVAKDAEEAFSSAIIDGDEGAAIRAFEPHDGNYVFNTWGGTPANGFFCHQNASLQKGWYRLSVVVASDSWTEVFLRAGDVRISSGPLTDRTQGKLVTATFYHNGGSIVIGAESTGWFECDDFRLTRCDTYYTASFDEADTFATLYLPFNASIPDGIEVFVAKRVTSQNSMLVFPLTENDEISADAPLAKTIPALTPVVIRATKAGSYYFFQTSNSTTAEPAGNQLKGTLEAMDGIPAYTAFYERNGNNLPASGLLFILASTPKPDGIATPRTSTHTPSHIYAPDGRLLHQPQHGINIARTPDGKVVKYMISK